MKHDAECQRIFSNPEYRLKAIRTLTAFGIPNAEQLDGHDLCVAISKMTCSVQRDDACEKGPDGKSIKLLNRIVVKCGKTKKRQCWDVVKLRKRIKNNKKFASGFSESQLVRIDKMWKATRASEDILPCNILSNSEKLCTSNDRCTYNTRSLVNALLGRNTKYDDGECYIAPEFLEKVSQSCEKRETKTLYAMMDDINHNILQKEIATLYMDVDDPDKFMTDMWKVKDAMAKTTRKMSRKQLCSEIHEYGTKKSSRFSWKRTGELMELSLTKLGIVNRYITFAVMWKIVGLVKIKLTKLVVRVMTHVMNLVLFIYENLFVSWGIWLVVFPGGRALVKKMANDPTLALLFLASFMFIGLKSDPILPNIDMFPLDAIQNELGITVVRNAGSNITRALPGVRDVLRKIKTK